jgi:hypothetical protein
MTSDSGTVLPLSTTPAAANRTRRRRRRLSTSALVVYALALALGFGVVSAYLAVRGGYPVGAAQVGAWVTWPSVGSRSADPYARAIVARRGEIPLALGEGLAFRASADSAGQTLDSACSYRIGSVTPQARLWTLAVYDANGRFRASDLERGALTSAEILRAADGGFTVFLSRSARPLNWLRLPESGSFTVVLRLYDTPVGAGSASLDDRAMPAIERLECGA